MKKTNKTFASILKLYLTFFTDKSLGKNTIIQGYRNRYSVIDHGHKKNTFMYFLKTYKLWCTGVNILF